MANSIENGATIRTGFYDCDWMNRKEAWVEENYSSQEYSLKINKKTVFGLSGGRREDFNPKEVAEKMGSIMKENGVKRYIIYNGERLLPGNNKWSGMGMNHIGWENRKEFRKTLEEVMGFSPIAEH